MSEEQIKIMRRLLAVFTVFTLAHTVWAILMLPLIVLAKIENYNRFHHLFEGLTHNKIYARQERFKYL